MIVDDNMHWLPENLFKDKSLRDSFISCIPYAYGEYARLAAIPGAKLEQIIIEKSLILGGNAARLFNIRSS